jgi:hypothetical protein
VESVSFVGIADVAVMVVMILVMIMTEMMTAVMEL